MKALVRSLVMICALASAGSYAWTRFRHVPVSPNLPLQGQSPVSIPMYPEAQEAQKIVSFAGPLADYVTNQETTQQERSEVETLKPSSAYKPSATDHVGGSVVGSSIQLLHQTFKVRNAVDVPFQIPAHAATPQLRGKYRSFAKQSGVEGGDKPEDVEFLVLNEEQFFSFAKGHAGEATFSAEAAHDQEVNTSLPPTLTQSVKYYLVFRNNSRDHGTKLVDADFRIDF
jgi:hypothetical protein